MKHRDTAPMTWDEQAGPIDESYEESPELRAALDEALREDDADTDPGIEVTRENMMKLVRGWIAELS